MSHLVWFGWSSCPGQAGGLDCSTSMLSAAFLGSWPTWALDGAGGIPREVEGEGVKKKKKEVGFCGWVEKKTKNNLVLRKKSPRLNLNSYGPFFVVIPLQITGIVFLQNDRRCQALIDCLIYCR